MTDTALAAVTAADDDREIALLAATAREFFAGFVDNTYLNQQEQSATGYDTERWQRFVDLGWTSLGLPERVGGAGAGIAAVAAVAIEFGRAAFASPWLATMRAATVLTAVAPPERADPILTRIADGVPHTLVAPADRPVRAEVSPSGALLLSGPPVVVEWPAQSETVVLLLPVTANSAAGESDSPSWCCAALPRDLIADRITPVRSVDNERSARFDPAGLTIPPRYLLGTEITSADAEFATAAANLLRAAVMVGGCEAVLEFSVRYAGERVQFGQPIGGFQAVRHHLARMAIAADAARLAYDEAVASLAGPERDGTLAALATFVAGRSYVEIVLTAAQIHGGVGTTVEHVLHHHFRRAKAMQLRSGRRANRLRELNDALRRESPHRAW
ncbi:acyl-CoA dehydrogenase family protein [Nocardia aurantia]|uniref:Acyl-CoA dehydrogenase FadE27 n=1 Tax=Nocardia aurantia TaxID=2585199 RepID=A0A7K0DTY3_9NOCA|nr:acyl-CoA dehydrogenase family protein [Nocardia aurantia]MQY29220.1 Acyl-CoA dehydrogenase FadE27 [Nocardia aurantia]